MKNRVLKLLSKQIKKILMLNLFRRWGSYVSEEFSNHTVTLTDDYQYIYLATNPLLYWRAETLFVKEPITITWLKQMKKDSVFFDIGGNVGVYTIYAGVRGVHVYSFEPESSNYYVLNKNIQLNNIQKNVKAYNFALSDNEAIDTLKLTSSQPGAAHTTFGDNEEHKQNNFATVFEQGALSLTMDKLVYELQLPIPQFIKIDVDGIEAKIIKGAKRLLSENKIESILIELNEESLVDQELVKTLNGYGFKISEQSDPLVLANNKGVLRECIFRR